MNKKEWIKIKNDNDIAQFMELYGFFHDSCIKEIKYISGMYVDNKLSMYPLNSKRDLSIIFQRQWKDPSTIEVIFEKIESLHLNPANEDYDGIIFNAYMCFENNKIVWFDCNDFENDDYEMMYNYSNITWVSASSIKYRIAENYLGKADIYINK